MSYISEFICEVQAVYQTGAATEHSYRPALVNLFSRVADGITALNEPKRVACGAPDFIIHRGEIVVGHVEAKDIGLGLRGMKDANKKQQDRYRKALPNLIYTNCLDWDFYTNGELIASVTIADFLLGIQPRPDQYPILEKLLLDYIGQRMQTISSPRVLAEMMAGKAGLIKEVLHNALVADKDHDSELARQYEAFREHLIHTISLEDFADVYAETIAYGMFAARLHDTTLDTFSRIEAMELLPKSNPFLRSLFSYLAGPDLDDRIKWVIDDLADVFQAANVAKLMEGFGSLTGRNDPFLHFYETFLAAYNPTKRKARGVWYTPEAVVNFIVRSVDEVLQTEFGIVEGLADTSTVTVDWDTGQLTNKGKRISFPKELHRIQILDPATGTGTFLAEVIKQVAPKVKGIAPGVWSSYIEQHLIPRLHGFELLMASYAMCHMKLDMILTDLGYQPTSTPPRLGVYLTNSLEEGEPANQTLPFAQWLSNEVKQANTVKRDMPIMCVIGNPPYSGVSQNMGDWIVNLIEEYKYVDGVHFGERKHWLHDDYVKFIRLSEHLIEKNGEGVLGFITNHGYLNNPTFRGMRRHLMQTFDKIYVLDLHGNANKREATPEGEPDKNVFDIRQGVAVIIGIKKRLPKTQPAEVFHSELWGSRKEKYAALSSGALKLADFKRLQPQAPYFMFYDVNLAALAAYDNGFSIAELFVEQSTGIITARDELVINFDRNKLKKKLADFLDPQVSHDETRRRFFGNKKSGKYLAGDSRSWRLSEKRPLLQVRDLSPTLRPILYRPLDVRWICYDPDLVDWPRAEIMSRFNAGDNLALITPRMTNDDFSPFVSTEIISNKSASRYDQSYFFPLYIYPSDQEFDQTPRLNFNDKPFKKLQSRATDASRGRPNERDVFSYIYGVLHCPAYRSLYAEFLNVDFPRIPWPASPSEFWDVADKGALLCNLHLMKPLAIGATPYQLQGDGNGVVATPNYSEGKIWLNATQYFDTVPEESWDFYIGGYQPAQKWLKDRAGVELSYDEVRHYQRMLKVLAETYRIMQTITMTLDVS